MKTYHLITIDITQIINSILNPNLCFHILKQTKVDQMDRSRFNGLKWIEQTELDRTRQKWIVWTELDRSGLSRPYWTEVNQFGPK